MRRQESEHLDYDVAFRDLLAQRRRRSITRTLRRLDLRLPSPGPVMAAGAVLIVLGWLFPVAQLAVTVGLILLIGGFVTSLMRPRTRHVSWRQRDIELPGYESWATRLYRMIYRNS